LQQPKRNNIITYDVIHHTLDDWHS